MVEYPHTTVSMQIGDVHATVCTTNAWTPEAIEHVLIRCRRQAIVAYSQLVDAPEPVEPEP